MKTYLIFICMVLCLATKAFAQPYKQITIDDVNKKKYSLIILLMPSQRGPLLETRGYAQQAGYITVRCPGDMNFVRSNPGVSTYILANDGLWNYDTDGHLNLSESRSQLNNCN
ncbi:hypothetical protein HMF3257_31640 [Spirosoma telluris]|uniref:Uncharacterized protein n=1 Tax=Spirosoma telluris TaxID=2183553 RepID=A0A327NUP2_9BACT|nr:hypothetical protein HMF3257_31640 [Spirosoma telluris]